MLGKTGANESLSLLVSSFLIFSWVKVSGLLPMKVTLYVVITKCKRNKPIFVDLQSALLPQHAAGSYITGFKAVQL